MPGKNLELAEEFASDYDSSVLKRGGMGLTYFLMHLIIL